MRKHLLAPILLLVGSRGACGGELKGMQFTHHDWELVCDNTRTCRAAGYQKDGDDPPVSVLLTRAAGPGTAVKGQLQIGTDYDEEVGRIFTTPVSLAMTIDGRAVGQVNVGGKSSVADLSATQTEELAAALKKDSRIEWSLGVSTWTLSSKGGAAVVLKMDEFQGRLGTRGALLRKGNAPEDKVLLALPVPVVNAAPVLSSKGDPRLLSAIDVNALRAELRKTFGGKEDDCDEFSDVDTPDDKLAAYALSADKLLVSAKCFIAAYNDGDAFWVINSKPPHTPVLVTTSGYGFKAGRIWSMQKGRGIADCVSTEDWTWDGKQFVHTSEVWSGMCKNIATGGAWRLPLLVTKVKSTTR
jgi:hypothetical protein